MAGLLLALRTLAVLGWRNETRAELGMMDFTAEAARVTDGQTCQNGKHEHKHGQFP
jgi:hypothetical protein